MKTEILVSTMNIKDNSEYKKLLNNLNIKENSVVINQCPSIKTKVNNIKNGKNKLFTFSEKGLSKSRNKAIKFSSADICVVADDDLKYVDNYSQIINDAYNKYKDADIIAFYVSSENPNNVKAKLKEGKVSFLNSFKIQSVQLTFKTKSIKDNNLKFDERFGAGSNLYMGEENIFLVDCLKAKLKIYSYPVEIAKLSNRESTWFKGYDRDYFKVKGACFYRISKYFWVLLFIQFIIRKRKEYIKSISSMDAFKNMLIGKINYQNTQ